jgi:hypothetical protein
MRRALISLVAAMTIGGGVFVSAATGVRAADVTSAAPTPTTLTLSAMCVNVGPQQVCIPDSAGNTVWSADANTQCNVPMQHLEVQSNISGPLGVSASGPIDVCGLQVNLSPCTSVASPSWVSCGPCNGQWTITGSYDLDFPFPVTSLTYDPTVCRQTSTTELHCTLRQGASL